MARPSFKPTTAMRRTVSIAAAGGMAHDDIALALGIARGTLLKHFEKELSIGALQRRVEVLQAMHKAAKGGNVAAQKAFMSLEPRTTVPTTPPAEAPDKGDPKKPAVGKKEQAQLDATTAGKDTEWESLLNPQPTTLQ